MKLAAGVAKHFRPLTRPLLLIAAFVALNTTFNIFTAVHDAAEHGQALALWEPVIWEYTSGAAILLCCGVVSWAVRIAMPGRARWETFVPVHAVASLAFSSAHILLMNAMRVAIYAAVGVRYRFGEAGFWYEYRKDLISYVILAAVFWFFARQAKSTESSTRARLIDIREGKRLLRVPVDEIAAIHAAGNYVEYVLLDDRRPLARQSLAAAHRELGSNFVRTHRSWVVNAAHVRELRPVGGGDYEIGLDRGLKAPLSRRFPEALQRLREQPTSAISSRG